MRTPATRFALHSCGDTLAISCRFVIKGVTFTMLCGFLSRTPLPVERHTVDALVAAACRLQGPPNFCYIGVNKTLADKPGFEVSERFHHSPLTVVARMIADGLTPFRPDRYEMIDFDIV